MNDILHLVAVYGVLFAAVLLLLRPTHFIAGRPSLPAIGFKQ